MHKKRARDECSSHRTHTGSEVTFSVIVCPSLPRGEEETDTGHLDMREKTDKDKIPSLTCDWTSLEKANKENRGKEHTERIRDVVKTNEKNAVKHVKGLALLRILETCMSWTVLSSVSEEDFWMIAIKETKRKKRQWDKEIRVLLLVTKKAQGSSTIEGFLYVTPWTYNLRVSPHILRYLNCSNLKKRYGWMDGEDEQTNRKMTHPIVVSRVTSPWKKWKEHNR